MPGPGGTNGPGGMGAAGQLADQKRKAVRQTTLAACFARQPLGRLVSRRLESGKTSRVMDLRTEVVTEQAELLFAELFDTFSNSSRVNCAALARQWNHVAMEKQIRNGGDWAGLHLKTSGQLRRSMDKVLKSMAKDEVERCWAARQAADGSGGVPAATGGVVRSQAGGNEAAHSASGAAHGAGGSGAMAGGASGTAVGSVGGAAGRSDAAAGSAGRAAAQGGGIYGAVLLAHCAAVLHDRGKEVPANDARIVERYRRGRNGGFIAAASRRKGKKTCQRCTMHDKAELALTRSPRSSSSRIGTHAPTPRTVTRASAPCARRSGTGRMSTN